MKILAFVSGAIGVLLGGLWLLQGLGIVRVSPILCFVDCEPIQGASVMWAIIGFVMITAGVLGILFSLKWRTRR